MADDSDIPSISSGAVGSRFVSQSDLDTARARRDEQWKAAYARLGQEPPPQPQEDSYDGRSLAEPQPSRFGTLISLTHVLQAAKQEEWEEKTKLANQFRALEEDEIMFLDSVRERQEEEERQRKEHDGEELKGFREAVASRVIVRSPPTISPANPPPKISSAPTTAPAKKDSKKSLKGVLVKKKPKPPAAALDTKTSPPNGKPETPTTTGAGAKRKGDDPPDTKRRKFSKSESDS
ncbi:hypothetical protein EW146_g592 [Bondarzewia mesenterica]|uniref:FAM192A/Fyv6 N-terminal domain-containing protein n=1 Tax=Bondarzewia mesenterica TaxID=1095465 RepID=A0A4S4M8C7_9AGAM|nr:hypothetical protein EW146_g592 [Bondarzewia mesenterica]